LENDLVPLLEQKKLKANVDKTFALSDAMQAFDYLASNKSFGKVVLTTE
jgi:NADPH:quinone reductase-like Zn-dependent oxidoreductase